MTPTFIVEVRLPVISTKTYTTIYRTVKAPTSDEAQARVDEEYEDHNLSLSDIRVLGQISGSTLTAEPNVFTHK